MTAKKRGSAVIRVVETVLTEPRPRPRAREAKAAVLTFANVLAGFLEAVAEVEEGADPGMATKRAVRRARARARAVRDAEASDDEPGDG